MFELSRSYLKVLAIFLASFAVIFVATQGNASSGSGSDGSIHTDSPDSDEPDAVENEDHSGSDHEDVSVDDDHSGSGSSGSDDVDDHSGSGGGDDDNSGPSENSGSSSNSGHSGDDDDDHSGNSGSSSTSGSNSGSTHSGGDDHSNSGSGSGSSHSSSGSSHSNNSGDNSGSHSRSSSSTAKSELRIETIEAKRGERARKGEVVLVSSRADMFSMLAKEGLPVIEVFKLPAVGLNGFRISVPENKTEQSVLDRLKKVDPESIATFNHVYTPARGGATLANTASSALLPETQETHARIGLVDARVDPAHPLLSRVTVSARVFGLASTTSHTHGTAVASRIAQVAPGANILVAAVFSEMQDGEEIASVDAIARGLDWLARSKVPVINLSLTGPANPILQAVTAKLIADGHVLVAAVGNEGPHAAPQYPAAYDDVVGVTAVDEQNRVYLYANQGAYVDFAAQGVNTKVATTAGATETVSGTSYAAPVVAVAIAKMMPRPDKEAAKVAQIELEREAKDAGAPGRDPVYGYGIVDLKPSN